MAGAASNLMEALSVRGQSISSGSEGSRASSVALARDLSVRSENIMGGGVPTKQKLLPGRSNTTRNKSKGA